MLGNIYKFLEYINGKIYSIYGGFMYIKRVIIENFKCFEDFFDLDLKNGLNILVGDNETGKSTILEAINLTLHGYIYGRPLSLELSQALFNNNVVEKYINSINTASKLSPPSITIELFFEIEKENDSLKALFEGEYNYTKQTACGIKFKIYFKEEYKDVYELLLQQGGTKSLPIEYYGFSWCSFARAEITPKSIPFNSAFVDSSNVRYQNGSDAYIAHIIKNFLSDEAKIKVIQVHRELADIFAKDKSIKEINDSIAQKNISEKNVKLSIDMPTRTAWESNLVTYLDDVPFNAIGKGEQCLVKTKLALEQERTVKANILLLEEPENHLSHTKLNKFIDYIKSKNTTKQVIISTHNSFVANKLCLDRLILLNISPETRKRSKTTLTELEPTTQAFFEKLAGYDTLRLILCKKAILVEGDSDELILQKAYKMKHNKLPIEDEIDVISVGTAFLRFLEIAEKLGKEVIVITDNDGDFNNKITKKYQRYIDNQNTHIKICADNNNDLPTLEPQIVNANKNQLDTLREVLEISQKEYPDVDNIIEYMKNDKTDCALKIFNTEKSIEFPKYILDAIA
ncbi:ATP-dependent endonuclease [Candidatus Termititenax persephonae]|uniref:ATP-dependent endonuclease n=1 Tax=Candidatus Termititenax persephonae TaxID=2218525 RepID=A0A388TGY2_9BACT|nr:ATP-dependent endonuclease [Candidatus Termititenax persephonae]